MDISELEKILSYNFKNNNILVSVITHRSYLNEHRDEKIEHNERLEFLGDAVLELITTEYLYNKYSEPEGILTSWRSALVRGTSLTDIAKKIGLNDFIRMSKGEQMSSGKSRDVILANAVEALIGGLYLDGGIEVARNFVNKYVIEKLEIIIEAGSHRDAKSDLQEICQDRMSLTPLYKLESETGPDHDKKFVSSVWLGDKKIATGQGRSKQESQQDAAANALVLQKN